MELPMNPLRLEATIGFMAGEPGSSLKIILFIKTIKKIENDNKIIKTVILFGKNTILLRK
jgi:hypothetical protein